MPHILIIDDERPIGELLTEVSAGAGFEVAVAETGVQGRRSIAARRPDLVVTDIPMPDKEDLETMLKLQRTPADVPIVAMSGGSLRGKIDLLSIAKRFGALRVYHKPFDPFQMLTDVQAVLDGP